MPGDRSRHGWALGSQWIISLSDLEQTTGFRIPPDMAATTISGMFTHRLARVPQVGDVIEEKCYRLRVLSAAHRRVERVAVERLDELTDAAKQGH